MALPDDQNIPGLEHTNYVTGVSNLAPTAAPAPMAVPVVTPVATPTPTPANFQDKSMTFEQRMARNQLPAPLPTPTPFATPKPTAGLNMLQRVMNIAGLRSNNGGQT